MIIKQAKIYEQNELRDFYNAHWGSKHPIINNIPYFNYYCVNGSYLNFVIAREAEDSEIVSACGFILSNSTDCPDAWTTLWLTKKGAPSSAGLQIVDFLATGMGFRSLSTNNARQETLKLYKFLGYKTAKMNHFYRLSAREKYKVAIVETQKYLPFNKTSYSIQLLRTPRELSNTLDASALCGNKPYKDIGYIISRYYDFPFYNYSVYGILDEDKHCRALMALRKAEANGSSVLRIVDLIGCYGDFAHIGQCIDKLLADYKSEYIDFYCYGVAENIIREAGFAKRVDGDGVIIPNRLEPYAPENTEYYLFCNNIEGFTMFKADGDQDKPNVAPAL